MGNQGRDKRRDVPISIWPSLASRSRAVARVVELDPKQELGRTIARARQVTAERAISPENGTAVAGYVQGLYSNAGMKACNDAEVLFLRAVIRADDRFESEVQRGTLPATSDLADHILERKSHEEAVPEFVFCRRALFEVLLAAMRRQASEPAPGAAAVRCVIYLLAADGTRPANVMQTLIERGREAMPLERHDVTLPEFEIRFVGAATQEAVP